MGRYRHQSTAINGVFNHVFNKYKSAEVKLGLYEVVPKDQRHRICRTKGLNKFLQEYRSSRGSKPSSDLQKNCIYVQNDFKSFMKYCQLNLK